MIRLMPGSPLDIATDARSLIGRRLLAREHGLERRAQIAAVRETLLAIVEEEVRRACRAERPRDGLRLVVEVRKGVARGLRVGGHVLGTIGRIRVVVRVDPDDADTARTVLLRHLREALLDV